MKKSFLLFVFIFMTTLSIAQIQGEDEVYLSGDVINPVFNKGGIDKFYEFVNKEYDVSKVTKPGKMMASFTITNDGDLKNIRLIEFTDIDAATEMIRVIKTSPKWEPAKKNGKPYDVRINFPYEFVFKEKPKVVEEIFPDDKVLKVNLNKNENDPLSLAGVEFRPEYPGGIEAFYSFINKNFKTPKSKEFKGGKIFVQFIIEKDGRLTDIKVLRNPGFDTDKEAIRVLQKSPVWKPAEQKGKKVRCQYVLPIVLQSN